MVAQKFGCLFLKLEKMGLTLTLDFSRTALKVFLTNSIEAAAHSSCNLKWVVFILMLFRRTHFWSYPL
jgi:hypothetical protein